MADGVRGLEARMRAERRRREREAVRAHDERDWYPLRPGEVDREQAGQPEPLRYHCDVSDPRDPHCIPMPPEYAPGFGVGRHGHFRTLTANADLTHPYDRGGKFVQLKRIVSFAEGLGHASGMRDAADRYAWKAIPYNAARLAEGTIAPTLPPPEFLLPSYVLGLASTTPFLRARRMIWRPDPVNYPNEKYELSLECGGKDAIGQQIYVHDDWRRRNTFRIVRRITAARRLGFFGGTWYDENTRATWLPVADGPQRNVPSFVMGEFELPYEDSVPRDQWASPHASPEIASEDLDWTDAAWVAEWDKHSVYTFYGREVVRRNLNNAPQGQWPVLPGEWPQPERWTRPLSPDGAKVVDLPAFTRPIEGASAMPAITFDASDKCRYGAQHWNRVRNAMSLIKQQPAGVWRTRAAEHAYNPDGLEGSPAGTAGEGKRRAEREYLSLINRGRDDREGAGSSLERQRSGRFDASASVVDAVFARLCV